MQKTKKWGFSQARPAAALFTLILLAGCGKAPKGQVLAIVNGEEVTIQQLNAELADLPLAIPPGTDRKALSRAMLQAVIDRELEVQAAREQGIDDTPRYHMLRKRNDEELLATMLGRQVAATVQPPAETDITQYMASHPLQFAQRQRLILDQLSFAAPRDRRRIAALQNAHSLDEAAATLQALGIAAERGQGAIDTGQTDPALAAQLLQAPAGEPILLPQGDRLVLGVVTAREPIALTKDQARLAAALALRNADLLAESKAQISQVRSKAKIEYVVAGYEPTKSAAAD